MTATLTVLTTGDDVQTRIARDTAIRLGAMLADRFRIEVRPAYFEGVPSLGPTLAVSEGSGLATKQRGTVEIEDRSADLRVYGPRGPEVVNVAAATRSALSRAAAASFFALLEA